MKGANTKSSIIEKTRAILALAKRKPELSQRELAKEVGVARNTVAKALAKVSDFNEEIELFRKQCGDILDGKQKLILSAINQKTVSEARLRDLAVSAGILFDKSRLERGLSTANLASIVGIAQRAEALIAAETDAETANPVRTDEDSGVEL
jgi:DNA-binding XRE family transcriptional regulator